jgi:formylmethanofuran dehydrogenase subunit B
MHKHRTSKHRDNGGMLAQQSTQQDVVSSMLASVSCSSAAAGQIKTKGDITIACNSNVPEGAPRHVLWRWASKPVERRKGL